MNGECQQAVCQPQKREAGKKWHPSLGTGEVSEQKGAQGNRLPGDDAEGFAWIFAGAKQAHDMEVRMGLRGRRSGWLDWSFGEYCLYGLITVPRTSKTSVDIGGPGGRL